MNCAALDHTKVGKTALYRLVPLADFDAVVVDRMPRPKYWTSPDKHGAKIEVATYDPPK